MKESFCLEPCAITVTSFVANYSRAREEDLSSADDGIPEKMATAIQPNTKTTKILFPRTSTATGISTSYSQ